MSDDRMNEHPVTALARRCYEESVANGWHKPREIDGVVRNASPAERVALIHEEATELLREIRKGSPASFWTEVDGKPEGAAAELADIVIRACDYAGMYGIALGDVIEQKLAYNRRRSDWTAEQGGMVL